MFLWDTQVLKRNADITTPPHGNSVSVDVKLIEIEMFFGMDTQAKDPSDGEGGTEFQFLCILVSKLEQISPPKIKLNLKLL